MPCPGLSLVGLICTVTVILVIDGSWGKEMSIKNYRPSNAVRHQQDLQFRKLCVGVHLNENEGKRKKCRRRPRWIRGLDPVALKLSNILEKYYQKREHLKEVYKGVANCGLSKCGKYPDVLPEKMKPNEFNCKKFKNVGDLKKWTSEILSRGYNGSKTYEDQFEELIRTETSPRFQQQSKNNGSRLKILTDFRSEINLLSLDIRDVKIIKTKERLNNSESATKNAPGLLQNPFIAKFQTDLMIREWGILQLSEEYLSLFCESLRLVYECWERKSCPNFKRKFQKKRRRTNFAKKEHTEVFGLGKEKWRYQMAEKTQNGNY